MNCSKTRMALLAFFYSGLLVGIALADAGQTLGGAEAISQDISSSQPGDLEGREYDVSVTDPGGSKWELILHPKSAFNIERNGPATFRIAIADPFALYDEFAAGLYVPKKNFRYDLQKSGDILVEPVGGGVAGCRFPLRFRLESGKSINFSKMKAGFSRAFEFDRTVLKHLPDDDSGDEVMFERLKSGPASVILVINQGDEERLRTNPVPVPECDTGEGQTPATETLSKASETGLILYPEKIDSEERGQTNDLTVSSHTESPSVARDGWRRELVGCSRCGGDGKVAALETSHDAVSISIAQHVEPFALNEHHASGISQSSWSFNSFGGSSSGTLTVNGRSCHVTVRNGKTEIAVPSHMTIGLEDDFGLTSSKRYGVTVRALVCPECEGKGEVEWHDAERRIR